MYSVYPRSQAFPHRPGFDRLQYAKTEGEGLVHFIMWMTSVPTYIVHVGRQRGGGVPYWKNEVEACSWPKRWRFERSLYEKCTAPGLKRITRAWNAFFLPGKTLPPSVYLGRYYQAFPLRFFFFLHTASDQKLDGGKARERGYVQSTSKQTDSITIAQSYMYVSQFCCHLYCYTCAASTMPMTTNWVIFFLVFFR